MKSLALGLALLTTVGVGGTAMASPGAVESVTLAMTRFYTDACNCYKARLFGRVSSGAAAEDVIVLRQYCGRSVSSSVAGATTKSGGFWEAEVYPVSRPEALASETYRARWNGQLSEPVTFRGKLSLSRSRLSGRRHRVSVFTSVNNPVSLKGRPVVLQRQTGGQWKRVASARLAPDRVKYYTFVATFTVPRRGWTLRALVPAKSAAPCFTASTSEKWTS
jgi:hypothetical protein